MIDYEDEGVTCFDPTKVIVRLMNDFPEAIVCLHDYGWRDYDVFQQMGANEGAIKIAENDARRRSPIFIFRLRTDTSQIIRGVAERYWIKIQSQEEIPIQIKEKFLEFVGSLRGSSIEIKSVRLEGNDEIPA